MNKPTPAKHLQVSRSLRGAVIAVLVTGVLGCNGGGDSDPAASTASAQTTPASGSVAVLPAPEPGPVPTPSPTPAPALTKTQVALDEFWGRYGAKSSFDQDWVELLTKLLDAEDKVALKDFKGARVIVDELIKKYPLMENNQPTANAWWVNFNKLQLKNPRPHFGEPGLYAHLRMLDDITKAGVSKTLLGTTPIQMAIVMPACSDIFPKTGPTILNRRLSPEIEADSYEAVRQSLRLLQSYILAISGGDLRLELNFYKIDSCTQINKVTGYDYNAPMRQLPPGVIEKTDMFWLIYPSDLNVGTDAGGGSGMGGFEASGKPVFISEDDWVVKKRAPDQGGGGRTAVERRMYLPEWVQHEFFHHLFGSWPEFGLEKTGHQWFDKGTWPTDFTGQIEEDYYAEALNKRLYKATPSIAQKLQRATK